MASRPTRATRATSGQPGSSPSASIRAAIRALPIRLAAVPSRLMAPSVPGGTGLSVVISTQRRPQRLPTSLPKVSPSLAAKLAAKPTSSRGVSAAGSRGTARASRAPVAADPQTFSGPRRPPRPSARPRACLRRKPRRVTSDPSARYSTTASQARGPRQPQRIVPRAPACTQPAVVSSGRRWARLISSRFTSQA
ncbi:hypothetical protein SYNGFB01_11520 [Synechococcus sp. GFB01]|nr:hypothetical protein SYNGFB01_11520 [Synechococcus sp. GFB01]